MTKVCKVCELLACSV